MPRLLLTSWSLAGLIALNLCACKRLQERMEITEKRPISEYAAPAKPLVASGKRFFEDERDNTPAKENLFKWNTPEGWAEAGPGSSPGGMRLIDLRFGPKEEGECYLSYLPGAAGGLAANVNRWRSQMGLPPYTAEELEKLPKKSFLHKEATYVTFDGDFKGMGAAAAAKDYRLEGLILEAPQFTLFVKMVGPKDLVTQNDAAFDQFCQSVSPNR